jgi:hypothetical protein
MLMTLGGTEIAHEDMLCGARIPREEISEKTWRVVT